MISQTLKGIAIYIDHISVSVEPHIAIREWICSCTVLCVSYALFEVIFVTNVADTLYSHSTVNESRRLWKVIIAYALFLTILLETNFFRYVQHDNPSGKYLCLKWS